MANYLIQDTTLTEIADAIRNKTGETQNIFVKDMASKIESMETLVDYENPNATCVDAYAFLDMDILRSVSFTIATSVGDWAFNGCFNLISVDFPLVTTIGKYSFGVNSTNGSDKLSSIYLPSCESVGAYAFNFRTNIVSVDLPEVKTISSYAFCGCKNLTDINVPKLSSVGLNVFENLNIKTINLPELSIIGMSTFINCSHLERVNIPKVCGIHDYAFFGCTRLKHISIDGYTDSSYSGRYIGTCAFQNCTNLQSVVLPNATAVMSLSNSDAFADTPIANGTGYIYVPDALVNSYKSANNWSVYASQIRPLSEYVEVDA